MITLNLIPESIRNENRLKHVYKLNFRLVTIAFFYLLILSTIILVSARVLVSTSTNALDQINFISQNSKAYNAKIKDLNNKIDAIDVVIVAHHRWDRLITDVYNLMPVGVKITNLRISQLNQSITMSVFAATRDDLLVLKDRINSSGYIEPIELPMNIILQKKDISFNFTSKLKFSDHENVNSEMHANK